MYHYYMVDFDFEIFDRCLSYLTENQTLFAAVFIAIAIALAVNSVVVMGFFLLWQKLLFC